MTESFNFDAFPQKRLINIKKMKNKLLFAILFTFSLISNVNAQKSKPNILFIAVDDLKPELGAYGNKLVKTPNIDRLAKMSTVFLNNYCQQAVCGPTRASLMTGMRPDYTKIWDLKTQMRDMNPNIVTLPQYLITQGYNTVGTGKIYHPSSSIKKIDPVSWSMPYLEPEETDYANNLGKPANSQYQKPENKALFAVKKERVQRDNDDEEPTTIKGPSSENYDVPDNAYDDGVIALLAKNKLIELSKNSKPYFMAVGFRKPHLPFVAPKKYWDLYNRADMPLATFTEHAKDAPEVAYHKSGELRNYIDIPAYATFNQPGNHVYIKEEKQKELIHGYYAAVSYMDAQVGILLNTLDSLGTLNNTIIVLWGDHGWHLGDHDLWEKHTNMEQATRAPLIVAAPGMKAGKSNSLSEHLDIFPTICDLAGLNVPTQLQGKSLKPIMQNNTSSVKDFSVSQYPRKLSKEDTQKAGFDSNKIMGYSLRTSKYRFTIWMNDFTSDQPFDAKKIFASEMYDYNADPLEKVNVYTSNNYKEAAKEMYSKMVNFFKSQESK